MRAEPECYILHTRDLSMSQSTDLELGLSVATAAVLSSTVE